MKIRTALAALAAVVALTLTGCASETAGTAAPVAGAEQAGPAASAGTDETTTDEASSEAAPTEESAGTGGGETMAVPNAGGCERLQTLAEDFASKILQKATDGGVTQADVDEVFSDENMAALPAELQQDAATLKDLSQQMVGKQLAELAEILPQVQTTFQSIATKAESACAGG